MSGVYKRIPGGNSGPSKPRVLKSAPRLDMAMVRSTNSCRYRVLKLARQPYYRWLANPIADASATTASK